MFRPVLLTKMVDHFIHNLPLALGGALLILLMPNSGHAKDTGEVNSTAVIVDGIGVFPLSEQTWRSKVMSWPKKVTDKNRVWIGKDFFTFEYGEPCAFTKNDFVKKFGYTQGGSYHRQNGRMVFTTGKKNKAFVIGFGGKPGTRQRPSNRFGVHWGDHLKDRFRLRMVLEQDKPTTWSFRFVNEKSIARNGKKEFTIKGTGHQEFEIDLGFVRNLTQRVPYTGIQLVCKTSGVTVRLASLKIAPSSANIYYRKIFMLTTAPISAHATFQISPVYDLYINGRKVDSGTRMYPWGIQKTIDLLPYLKVGKNTIAFRNEFFFWAGGTRSGWLFEGIAIDAKGKLTRFLGDKSWKCNLAAGKGWMLTNYDDRTWYAPQTRRYTNGMDRVKTLVSRGLNPRHMGLLDVSLVGRKYPVFDHSQSPTYRIRLPLGMKKTLIPEVDVYRAGTKTKVETARAQTIKTDGMFRHYRVILKTRTVGPYRLIWKLLDDKGKIVESRREEMVIVGPIPQDTFALDNFEEALTQRLELERKIDCTSKNDSQKMLDHSGMYSPTMLNKGRIVKTDSLTYRETGGNAWDYFAYPIKLQQRGKPYLIEVIVPDDQERYIYSGVLELHPVRYSNNSPGIASFASTGSALTGGRFPLTGGTRTIRYIHYPSSDTAAVVVMNGRRDSAAAACQINIYRVIGGLPALKIPVTDRRLGTHNERLSLMGLTLASENPVENDRAIWLSGHRDAWYHWYKIFERKIRLLRHQGRNMTIEGLFMYTKAEYPSLRNSGSVSNQEFDAAFLGMKMYEQNNIHCLVGMEYMCNQAMVINNSDTTSDRRMWLGAPSLQKVDRYGRQLASLNHAGVNFLHPTVEKYFMDIIQEIRDRYGDIKAIEGMMMVVGNWYAPGFGMCGFNNLLPLDIGYGDYTVGLFEHESGIHLGIDPKAPNRFAQRYDLLTTQHRKTWLKWRAEKVQSFIDRMSKRLRRGNNPWSLKLYATFKHGQLNLLTDFENPAAHRKTVRNAMAKFLRESGFPLERYKDDPYVRLVAPLVTVGFKGRVSGQHVLNHQAWNMNPGAIANVNSLDALFMNTALDEVDCPAAGAPHWPWRGTRRGVFVARGIQDNRMADFVNVLANATPNLVITQWMDCNMETAGGEQLRRFARELYVTPKARFTPLPPAQYSGVVAQTALRPEGGFFLRLVNNSPYPSNGTLATEASSIGDLVYDKNLPAGKGGAFAVAMRPNDIRTFLIPEGTLEKVQCRLSFAEDVEQRILQNGTDTVNNVEIYKSLPSDKAVRLKTAVAQQDGFAVYNLLTDFEVSGQIQTILKTQKANANQKKLLADINRTGVARIDFASVSEHRTSDGHRWLPDQKYLGRTAYGNTGAHFADRGNLAIANTRADRVYQTEAYGHKVIYQFFLPNGEYNLRLHIAETYPPNKRPKARRFRLDIQGKRWPKVIDPYELCGGFATAYVLKLNQIKVTNGKLTLRFTGQVGVQGLEIFRSTSP